LLRGVENQVAFAPSRWTSFRENERPSEEIIYIDADDPELH